jgi:hypothetical protein
MVRLSRPEVFNDDKRFISNLFFRAALPLRSQSHDQRFQI